MDEPNVAGWALRLVIAVMEYEDAHGRDAASPCLSVALGGVPESLRLMALGYRLAMKDMNLAGEVRDGA